MAQDIPLKLQELVTQGARDFFGQNGVTNIEVSKSGVSSAEFQWTGIIGFSGDLIRGSFAVTCQAGLLNHTHPNVGMRMPVEEADRVDWLGEIANQLLGRIKNLTLEYSVNFSLSAPSVVKGQALEVVGQDKRMITVSHFTCDSHPLTMTMICTINPNFNFDTAVKTGGSRSASEGESLLF